MFNARNARHDDRELDADRGTERGGGSARRLHGARDMSSHGNGYADVVIRDGINQGRIDGPRYQVSTLGILWTADRRRGSRRIRSRAPSSLNVDEARSAVRDQIARRCGLDQAVSRRRVFVQRLRRSAVCDDVSDAGAAGADRRDTSSRQEDRLPRVRRRRLAAERIDAGCDTVEHAFGLTKAQAKHDRREEAVLRSDAAALYRALHG